MCNNAGRLELQVVDLKEAGIEGGESSSKAICSCVITAKGLSWIAQSESEPPWPAHSLALNVASVSIIAAYMVLSQEWAVKYLTSWLDLSMKEGTAFYKLTQASVPLQVDLWAIFFPGNFYDKWVIYSCFSPPTPAWCL